MWNRGDGTGNACSDRAARGEADQEDAEDIGASTTKRLASHAHRKTGIRQLLGSPYDSGRNSC
jgi:hypothetical protein